MHGESTNHESGESTKDLDGNDGRGEVHDKSCACGQGCDQHCFGRPHIRPHQTLLENASTQPMMGLRRGQMRRETDARKANIL